MKKIFILSTILTLGILFSCTKVVSSKPNFIFKEAPNKETVARFNGENITYDQLYKGIENEIYEHEKKLFDLKFNRLKMLVLERLMKMDKRKKGLTNDEYMEKYIAGKIEISDKEAKEFAKGKVPEGQMNDQILQGVKRYLTAQKKMEVVEKWMADQTKNNPVEVFIRKVKRPVYDVEVGNSPFYGNKDAKVTVVEFSDFECPYCAKGADVMTQIKKKYGKKVRLVFKHFPLPFHKKAKGASEVSLCLNEQKPELFWKAHDEMFKNQDKLGVEELKAMAKKLGADTGKLDECLKSKKFIANIDADMTHGTQIGVKSTPTFFVNGQMITGAQDFKVFEELIEEALN
jgi:protein-disulfide isomerase